MIVKALKNLYVSAGGDAKDVAELETTAQMINALTEAGFLGEKELPDVTSDDNGKVLGVVEGAWSKADIPAELPAVTTDDNGKLLGVAEGAWGKVDAPSVGTKRNIVEATCSSAINTEAYAPPRYLSFPSYTNASAAKEAIAAMLENGEDVVLHVSYTGTTIKQDVYLYLASFDADTNISHFSNIYIMDTTPLAYTAKFDTYGSCSLIIMQKWTV